MYQAAKQWRWVSIPPRSGFLGFCGLSQWTMDRFGERRKLGEKYVQEEFLGEESLGEKYMDEKSVQEEFLVEESRGEKYMGEKYV